MLKRLMAVVVLTGIFCCGVATSAMAAENDATTVELIKKNVTAFKAAGDAYSLMLSLTVNDRGSEFTKKKAALLAGLRDAETAFKAAGQPNGLFLAFGRIVGRGWDIDDVAGARHASISVESVTPEEIVRVIEKVLEQSSWVSGTEGVVSTFLDTLSEQEWFLRIVADLKTIHQTRADGLAGSIVGQAVFSNNNGLDSTGLPIVIPATALSLGTLTGPFGGAIAFGDGSFPAVAGALDSHTLSTAGGLTAFSMGSGVDTGTNALPTVCSVTQCTDSTTVRWGAWGVGGSGSISGQPATMTANSQLHYLVGTATTPAQYATLTGVVAYLPVGGTTPTGIDGRTYSAAIGNINVNFTANTATLASYALSGNGLNTANYTFTNVPITIATDGNAKVLTGILTNTANNTLNTNGLFLGPAGSHLGMGFKTTDQAGTLAINQVQAFKKP